MGAFVGIGATPFGEREQRPALVGRAAELRVLESAMRAVREDGKARTVTIIGAAGVGKTRLVRDFLSRLREPLDPAHGPGDGGVAPPRVFRGSARQGGGAHDVFARFLRARFGVVEGMSDDEAVGLLRAQVSDVFEDRKVGDVCFFLGQLMGLAFADSPLLRVVRSDPTQMHLLRRAIIKRFLEADARAVSGAPISGDRGPGASTPDSLLVAPSPTVLVFDDLHHAHEDSLELLSFLVESLDAPILTLCIARPEMMARHEWGKALGASGPRVTSETGADRHVLLELPPLSEADAATVMQELLEPCGDADVEELVFAACTMAGGNPALLERMVRIFHDMGVVQTSDAFSENEVWTVHPERIHQAKLPLTVEDAVQARIAALAPKERALLERAAVMGSVFWLGGLLTMKRLDADAPTVWLREEATDEAELRATLRELCDRDYVLHLPDSAFPDDEEYAFKHNLERETLLRLLPKRQTKRFHEAIADWLSFKPTVRSHEELLGQLAHHERLAGRLARAVESHFEAGGLSRERYANAKAADDYEKGFALVDEGVDVSGRTLLRALHDYGDVLQILGKNDEALAVFKRLLAHAFRSNLPSKGGVAHNRIGRLYRETGRLAEAHVHLDAALALFEGAGDERGVASTVDDLGKLFRLRGDYARALDVTTRALGMRTELGDRRSIAVSLSNLGRVHRDFGQLARARDAFERALLLRREIGDLVGVSISLVDLGIVAEDEGDDAGAHERLREALDVVRETGDRGRWAVVLTHLGEVEVRLGDVERAVTRLKQAEEIAADRRDDLALGRVARALGRAYLAQGDREASRASAQQAIDTFIAAQDKAELGIAHRVLGEILAATSAGADELLKARAHLLQSVWLLDEAGRGIEFARSCAVYARMLRRAEANDPKAATEADQFERKAAEIFARSSS